MKVKKKITAMALALTMVFAMVPLMGAEKSYALQDVGEVTIDLTGGPMTYDSNDNTIRSARNSIFALTDVDNQAILISSGEDITVAYYDLDKDGTNDVVASLVPKQTTSGGPLYDYKYEAAETSSIVGAISFEVTKEQAEATMQKTNEQFIINTIAGMRQQGQFSTEEAAEQYEQFMRQALDEQLETDPFASTVTFILPLKANTLTLKGKTVKIKAKKLKKKKKTYAISKFLTVSKAQGTVTYAKVSGNKKIKISSNGKVTLKKKLKKGKYKVTVKVTAAGNNIYKPVTKNATFKIKVK